MTSAPAASLPTWLAVIVPVLAAMVWGVAGVAGALLGGYAAMRTAERNAVLARENEQRRWNRERRERVYVALLERRNHLIALQCQKRELMRKLRAHDSNALRLPMTEVDAFYKEVHDAEQSLEEALAAVELTGSAEAVTLARRWVEHLCDPPWLPIPRDAPVREAGLLCGHSVNPPLEPVEFRDPFVALIRKELGIDN